MPSRKRQLKRPVGMHGATMFTADYRVMMSQSVFGRLRRLDGHSLRWAAQEESTPATASLVQFNQQTRKVEMTTVETERKYITKRDFEIGIPPWEWSYLEEVVSAGADYDYFRVRSDCPYCDRRAYLYEPQTKLKEIMETENLSMGGTDPQNEAIGKTTGANLNTFVDIKAISAALTGTPATGALYAVAWMVPDYCGNASECPGEIVVGGVIVGDAVGENAAILSTNISRFDTETHIALGLGATDVITDILVVGETQFFTWADDIDTATAADGGVLVRRNGAVSEAEAGGSVLGNAMYGLTLDGDGRIIAVGQNGAIFVTTMANPTVMTDISVAAETDDFIAIASGGSSVSYIAASNGNAFSLVASQVTDITTDVKDGQTVAIWNKVASLSYGHVIFCGPNGIISETIDDGEVWFSSVLNQGAGNVLAATGHTFRTLVSIDSAIFERSPLELAEENEFASMKWRELELEGGQEPSGNIVDMAILYWLNGPNVLAFVSDEGEVGYGRYCHASC